MKKVLLGDSVFMIELVLIPVFGIIEQKPENRGMSYKRIRVHMMFMWMGVITHVSHRHCSSQYVHNSIVSNLLFPLWEESGFPHVA